MGQNSLHRRGINSRTTVDCGIDNQNNIPIDIVCVLRHFIEVKLSNTKSDECSLLTHGYVWSSGLDSTHSLPYNFVIEYFLSVDKPFLCVPSVPLVRFD